MTVDDLRSEMHEEFGNVREAFDAVHVEFGRIEAEFGRVREEFGRVREEFGRVWGEFGRVWEEFARVRDEIRTEGETTRRHVDIRFEELRDLLRLVAEGTAGNSKRLDDHERRISRLEDSGRS